MIEDRVNIGQAKLDGLMMTLNLSSGQYNASLSIFFVTYVLLEVPSNLILKKIRPSRWMPMIMISWGIVMTLMGRVQSYGSLLVCRLFLGAFESGLFPGATLYFSSWYKRQELSWRVSILFSAAALAGAFGGLLARGIGKMNGIYGQEGWRWIFYIEGIVKVVIGVVAMFLINVECERVIARLHDSSTNDPSQRFSWKQVKDAIITLKVYVWSLCYIGLCVPFYSLAFFSPTIIDNLGFFTYQAQLLTVPSYLFAFFTTMITVYFSDKYTHRSIFIIYWLLVSIIAYIILIFVDFSPIKYVGIILATGGLSSFIATSIAFISCNVSPQIKRATSLAFMISFGNIGGIISAIILLCGLRIENRRRGRFYMNTIENENRSEKRILELGDEHVTLRYMLYKVQNVSSIIKLNKNCCL